ncbi:predicted protein [Nematostella vectensis]|uniref:Major facilitator superfamily (MFS) profile domain-containing protein n=1 Tax=Nematostella vectensis TaxID=45351 RepID=A7RGB3_NEMVE|nr:predicted protein [Nematostella vectensis]|eukprot:XP_001641564.1 predicted protein [Nematostella vectensis]
MQIKRQARGSSEGTLLSSTCSDRSSLSQQSPYSNSSTQIKARESPVKSVKDRGWAWVICAAAFFDIFIVLGTLYTFGVLYVPLLAQFKASKAETGLDGRRSLLKSKLDLFRRLEAWVGSIGQFSIYFVCYLSSLLAERFGCRKITIVGGIITSLGLLISSFCTSIKSMYFTYGILVGIGSSLSYLPALVMVAFYFEKKRSLATGIAAAGGNIGALILAPLQQTLVEHIGWRNCMRCLSAFSSLIIVCGLLFKPLPEREQKICMQEDSSDHDAILTRSQRLKLRTCHFPRAPRFIVWAIAGTVACFGYFMPHVHIVRLSEELGSSYRDGSLLLTYMSAASAVGKVIFGKISDSDCVNTLVLYQMCMVLTALTSVISILATGYQMLVVYAVILGLLDGSFIGLMSIVTFECSEPDNMSQAWGGVLMCMSFTMLVGAPAGGWLGTITGRYRNVFFLAGGPMLLGAAIFSFIWCVKAPKQETDQRQSVYLPGSDGEILVYERLTVV